MRTRKKKPIDCSTYFQELLEYQSGEVYDEGRCGIN